MEGIKNLKEKRLVVARQIILEQAEPTDENIISKWDSLFSGDNYKLNHSDNIGLFDWMCKFTGSNNIESCNERLERLRREGERNLKTKGKHVRYGAKLVRSLKIH